MTQRAAARRQPHQGQREQYVVLGSIVVLAVSVVIVLVGLYLAAYRPPRQHVLTAGNQRYNAQAVERRTRYLILNQQTLLPKDIQGELVTKTLDLLEHEEILRQRAPAVVSEVKPEDITAELQSQLVPTPPSPTITLPDGSTATPNASATATPTVDQAAYAKALQKRLTDAGMRKSPLDALIAAQVLEQRLQDQFKKDLPKTAPQVLLSVARVSDQAKADTLRSVATRPGVDFNALASVNSVQEGGPTGPIGWVIPDNLDQPMRDVVKGMKAGDISPVTRNVTYFEVYKVVEASGDHEISEDQQDKLVKQKEDEWFDKERANVKIERDLSASEDKGIRAHAIADYQKVAGTTSAR
jgi:hypothetical protein